MGDEKMKFIQMLKQKNKQKQTPENRVELICLNYWMILELLSHQSLWAEFNNEPM